MPPAVDDAEHLRLLREASRNGLVGDRLAEPLDGDASKSAIQTLGLGGEFAFVVQIEADRFSSRV